ncbi:MAG: prepilin-type N-terminal cleavage/methylation domain-containing protein [Elusimicrobia bacterium]|nr:prepilin-type N-terminal cleavage/methylation domain-containing protein [Elusimicrobiota bacterium]
MGIKTRLTKRPQAGFTLIELLVVVLIIGILAAIAVPQYFKVVEKGRFAEATTCFSTLKGAQERYFLKNNTYAGSTALLDTTCGAGKAFAAPGLVGGATWTGTLVRTPAAPSPYLGYTVTFVGPAGTMSCSQSNCTTDLLP